MTGMVLFNEPPKRLMDQVSGQIVRKTDGIQQPSSPHALLRPPNPKLRQLFIKRRAMNSLLASLHSLPLSLHFQWNRHANPLPLLPSFHRFLAYLPISQIDPVPVPVPLPLPIPLPCGIIAFERGQKDMLSG